MITHVSFDLDGTLTDEAIDKRIWNDEIPRRYAHVHRVSIQDARKIVFAAYASEGTEPHPRWTDIAYWFETFKLGAWDDLIALIERDVTVFPDARAVLATLAEHRTLIIVTANEEKFLRAKLRAEGLAQHIARVFCAPTLGCARKRPEIYRAVLAELKIPARSILHVGDDPVWDVECPRAVGMHAVLLDRSGRMPDSIRSLAELSARVHAIERSE